MGPVPLLAQRKGLSPFHRVHVAAQAIAASQLFIRSGSLARSIEVNSIATLLELRAIFLA